MKIDNLAKTLTKENYYPFYIIALGILVLFFQLDGSVGNWDEAVYSEVAKESLLNNNWLDFYYKGEHWFEKPPLIIWLTIISYKLFGISEFAIWFFPAVFGIIGGLGTYYIAKKLFNAKVGLMAALVLFSIPHYVLMARNNMTDIFLVSSLSLSFLFFMESNKHNKFLLFSAFFFGIAFMAKSVVSFTIFPVAIYYLRINKSQRLLKNKYLLWSVLVFLTVVVPWHLLMLLKYQQHFLDDYIKLHLFDRYTKNILNLEYSSDILFYLKVILKRTASWWFIFIILLPFIVKNIKDKIKNKELTLLLIWIAVVLLFFTLSTTKLHYYVLPLYIPFSILIAYSLYNLCLKKSLFIIFPLLAVFQNTNPFIIKQASDFGESRLLFYVFIHKIFNPSVYILYLFLFFLVLCFFLIYFLKKERFATTAALILIFLFSFILPFYPNRAPLAKEIGRITKGNADIHTIYHMDYKELDIDGSLVYYNYPIQIKSFKKIEKHIKLVKGNSYCLIDRSEANNYKWLVYDFYPCEILNN